MGLMAVSLFFGSLITRFVPNVSAEVTFSDVMVMEGDMSSSTCTTTGTYDISIRVNDDVNVNDTGDFEAEYSINGGDSYPFDMAGSGEGYADFTATVSCGPDQDFYNAWSGDIDFFFSAYNNTTEEYHSDNTYFTLNVLSAPEIIEYENDNFVEFGVFQYEENPISFEATVAATGSAVASIDWAIPEEELSGTPEILYGGTLGSDEWIDFNLDLTPYDLEDGTYTLEVVAENNEEMSTLRHFTMIVDLVPGGLVTIDVDQLEGGQIEFDEEPMTITGLAAAPGSTIESVTLNIPDETVSEPFAAVDGTFDEEEEDFTLTIDSLELADGEYEASITVVSADETEETVEFDLIIDVVPPAPPSCGNTWVNQVIDWEDETQTAPNFQSEYTYPDITCTDPEGIASVQYRMYHNNDGVDVFNPDGNDDNMGTSEDNGYEDYSDFTSGNLGDTSLTFDLDIAMPGSPNYDGSVEISMKVTDTEGNSKIYRDPFVIDYEDQTEPLLSLQLIRPEVLTDTTPTITGTCTDNFYVETNSNITDVEVSIDGDPWESIPALDGAYDSRSERFAYTTEVLELGDHEIDVRCTDAGGNTYTTDSDTVLTFTIVAPSDSDTAENVPYVEPFNDHDHHDYAASSLIWGNDKLRLKEDIEISRTAIDTTNYRDMNDIGTSIGFVIRQGVDENIAWYAKGNEVWRLDRSDNSTEKLDETLEGARLPFDAVHDLREVEYNGRRLLFIGTSAGLTIFDLTNTNRYDTSVEGSLESMVPDFDRGRFGFYMNHGNTNPGDMKVTYWEFSDDLNPIAGATRDRIPVGTAGMSGDDVVRIFDSPYDNEYYISVFNVGLFRYNDNNTPFDYGDDQATQIVSNDDDHGEFNVVFAVTFDPDGKLIIGTSPNENGQIFVLDDDGGTPYDNTDDVIYRLAQTNHLAYNDVFDLTYVEGLNGVGDQLFIRMEHNNPVYLNFNSTYSDPLDDTFIELKTNNGIRPSMTKFLVHDYNTLYANIDRQGLYEITLERGWEESGHAIALPPRPAKTLVIENILAEASLIDPISFIPGSSSDMADAGWGGLVQQAYAQSVNITYEVSVDDGINWQPVTLGELQQLDLEDYRLQFRITMEPSDGASPVVNTYSVQYGAYPNPEQLGEVDEFQVTVSPASFGEGENFTLEVDAVDVIDYVVPDYNGTVDLVLQDSDSTDHTDHLNIITMAIVNGEGSASGMNINQAGTYTIVASNADAEGTSNEFTVTSGGGGGDDGSDPNITLTLTSNNYEPCAGQGFTLRWTSTNLTEMKLNGTTVDLNGTSDQAISVATEFVLDGTGPYGNMSTRRTIPVKPADECRGTTPITQPYFRFNPVPDPNGDDDGDGIPNIDDPDYVPPTSTGNEDGSDTGSGSDDGSNNGPGSGTGGPGLEIPEDITVIDGEPVTIWWEAPDADAVIVSYLGGEGSVAGSFQFYPRETQTITITAYRGDEVTTKTITITVKRLPFRLGEIIPPAIFPAVVAGIRHAAFTWLTALIILKLLAFFKRKPGGEVETGWFSWLIKQGQVLLWVISPLILIFSITAAGLLGGFWFIIIALLCIGVSLRHLVVWVRNWNAPKVDDKKWEFIKPKTS